MPGGLFELRKDDITGWWVAVVVDREYDRSRFAMRADDLGQTRLALPELRPRRDTPASGSERSSRRHSRSPAASARRSRRTRARTRPWASSVTSVRGRPSRRRGAPRPSRVGAAGHRHRDAPRWHATRSSRARTTPGIEYVQVVQNVGVQAGARTDHLCLDLYELPQIPHRLGEELGGAARYMIKERICPWCRLVKDEVARRDRLVYADAATVCFAPYASRSPFELWVVPRHHEADFGQATDAQLGSAADALQGVSWASWTCSTARPTTWCSTRRRSSSASTRHTTGTGRSTPDCARSRASSWARACRSTRVSPEGAVAELLAGPRRVPRPTGLAAGTPSRAADRARARRSWQPAGVCGVRGASIGSAEPPVATIPAIRSCVSRHI